MRNRNNGIGMRNVVGRIGRFAAHGGQRRLCSASFFTPVNEMASGSDVDMALTILTKSLRRASSRVTEA